MKDIKPTVSSMDTLRSATRDEVEVRVVLRYPIDGLRLMYEPGEGLKEAAVAILDSLEKAGVNERDAAHELLPTLAKLYRQANSPSGIGAEVAVPTPEDMGAEVKLVNGLIDAITAFFVRDSDGLPKAKVVE